MPQLDTVYIFMTYLWTWMMLYLAMQKTKTFLMTTHPMICLTPNKPTPQMPWL